MRRARVLVFAGLLSASGMLVNAVACSNSVDLLGTEDAGDAGPVADASVIPDADAAALTRDAFDGNRPEASSDGALDVTTADTSPEEASDSPWTDTRDAGSLDADATTDSPESTQDAPTETGADSPAGDGAPGDSMDEEVGSPATDAGDAGAPENGDGATCGDAAVGATACAIYNISPACLSCADQMGCLDPNSQNLSCDQFADGGGQDDCLATFLCAVANNCGVTLGDPSCLCGSDDASACAAGTEAPAGACANTYFAGFGTHNVQTILDSYNDPSTPSGDGNLLVQCLQMPPGCSSCF